MGSPYADLLQELQDNQFAMGVPLKGQVSSKVPDKIDNALTALEYADPQILPYEKLIGKLGPVVGLGMTRWKKYLDTSHMPPEGYRKYILGIKRKLAENLGVAGEYMNNPSYKKAKDAAINLKKLPWNDPEKNRLRQVIANTKANAEYNLFNEKNMRSEYTHRKRQAAKLAELGLRPNLKQVYSKGTGIKIEPSNTHKAMSREYHRYTTNETKSAQEQFDELLRKSSEQRKASMYNNRRQADIDIGEMYDETDANPSDLIYNKYYNKPIFDQYRFNTNLRKYTKAVEPGYISSTDRIYGDEQEVAKAWKNLLDEYIKSKNKK
jgi:hypothetical protein